MSNKITRIAITLSAATVLSAAVLHAEEKTEPITKLKVIYFGNSLTECSTPELHTALGKSAGKTWEVNCQKGPGWTIHFHRDALLSGKINPEMLKNRGDLTIEPGTDKQATTPYLKLLQDGSWDGMLLQPFGSPLKLMAMEATGGKTKYNKLTDIGDIQASIDMIDVYLKLHPNGKIFMYQNWPDMKPGKIPPADKLPDWAKVPGARMKEAEFPLREQFDYEHEWLVKKYAGDKGAQFWLDNVRCQDIGYQLFEALKAHYPDLWKSGRLVMIPVGDVFLALHRKMKAGAFPGVTNVTDFYTDIQHIRIGLPRYTTAATFYAVMFRANPAALDWKVYNSKEAFLTKYDKPHYDLNHDKGDLFEITPERAKIVNDTIWEVVTNHLYTGLKK